MPRAGLTRASVVAAAASLADEVGYDGLTLAALAGRLGVAVPSLYKHVDGLEALRRDVAIVAIRELGAAIEEALRAVPSTDPAAELRALADGYRGYALAHPGCYDATLRAGPPNDPEYEAAASAVLGAAFAVLAGRGLLGDDAIDATRGLRAALHGFVSLEAAGGFGIPQDVERSFARLVAALDRGLDAYRGLDASRG